MKRLLLCGFLLGMVGLAPLVHAQSGDDGLSEGEIILLERLYSGLEKPLTYTNYSENVTEIDAQRISYTLDSQTSSIAIASQRDRTTTIIRDGDELNTLSTITLLHEEEAPGEDLNYSMTAEVRLVDGTLYVQAAYTAQEGDVPTLPDGWVTVDELSDYPALAALNLGEYLNDNLNALNDLTMLKAAATEVLVRADTINGTAVDTIGVMFTGEGFVTVFKALQGEGEISPLVEIILANLSEDSRIILTVSLDSDNNPLQAKVDILLNTDVIDLNAIDPTNYPVGATLRANLRVVREATLTSFNGAGLTPAIAPTD